MVTPDYECCYAESHVFYCYAVCRGVLKKMYWEILEKYIELEKKILTFERAEYILIETSSSKISSILLKRGNW